MPGSPPAVFRAAVLLAAAALLAGCSAGSGDEAASPAGATTQSTGASTGTSPTPSSQGRSAYISVGCGACHGQNGQGTDVGPALAGHTEEVVIRQVRTPLGEMPAYSQDRLSDEDLKGIAAYVVSLKATEKHVEPVKLSDVLATHHWMALGAIDAGDRKDALHHIGHIISIVKGEHLAAMKEAREHLLAGDKHEAEHLIEEMLADKKKPKLGLKKLHLRLALAAVQRSDRKEALHQAGHFVELSATHDKSHGQELLTLLKQKKLKAAEMELKHLLG